VNVTGMLAQMGRGMIQDVSDEMFQIFSERMRAELETPGAPAVANPATNGVGAPGDGAGSGAAAATPSPSPLARVEPARPEALDAAALGARVARRSAVRLVKQPVFWALVLLAAAGLAYLLLQRSSSAP